MSKYKRPAKIKQPVVLEAKSSNSKATEEVKEIGNANTTVFEMRHCLVPIEGAFRVSQRFALGEARYSANQWKNGDWRFLVERINNLEHHLLLFKREGNTNDDNIGAILWAGYCIAWFEYHKPADYRKALDFIQGF